ncbi:MAG TPA: hypothetical protein VGS21_10380, partial [Acidimicrobiales bacterium]|nr:hypothetical protein [Acidimicrobiales bacterium]
AAVTSAVASVQPGFKQVGDTIGHALTPGPIKAALPTLVGLVATLQGRYDAISFPATLNGEGVAVGQDIRALGAWYRHLESVPADNRSFEAALQSVVPLAERFQADTNSLCAKLGLPTNIFKGLFTA